MFSESPFADKEKFRQAFDNTDYTAANLDYYHEMIGNWSQSKGARKLDWIATAKNWMLRDYAEGKLVKSQQQIQHEQEEECMDLEEVINMMYAE